MDSSHAFDFPLDDLSTTQYSALDAALTRESISHEWHGSTLSVDVAYEARVTTLIDQARNQVLPYSPPVSATPTAPVAPTTPAAAAAPVYPAAGYAQPGYAYGTNYGYVGYVTQVPNNGMAVASMVCGILALVLCGVLTGIPAIIMGIVARRQIRTSGGAQQGDGMALAGLIMGGIATAIWLAIIAIYVIFFLILATAATTAG